MGKARSFTTDGELQNEQQQIENENYSMAAHQNPYNQTTHFSDNNAITTPKQANQPLADLRGALFRGNVGFILQTAILDVPTNTINILEDAAGNPLPRVSIDKIVTLSTGTTADLITILGAQRPGQRLRLYNTLTNTITIKHTAAATPDTIRTPTTGDLVVPGNGVIDLTYEITSGQWRIVGNIGSGGGGLQTPWLSNIDAATFLLQNLGGIEFRGSTQLGITPIDTATPDGTFDRLEYDADVLGGHDFYVNRSVTTIPRFGITQTSIESNVDLVMNDKNIINTTTITFDAGSTQFILSNVGGIGIGVPSGDTIDLFVDDLSIPKFGVTETNVNSNVNVNIFGTTANPQLKLFRDDPTPIDADFAGQILFNANTTGAGATERTFGFINVTEEETDDATRTGKMEFLVSDSLNSRNGTTYINLFGSTETIEFAVPVTSETITPRNIADTLGTSADNWANTFSTRHTFTTTALTGLSATEQIIIGHQDGMKLNVLTGENFLLHVNGNLSTTIGDADIRLEDDATFTNFTLARTQLTPPDGIAIGNFGFEANTDSNTLVKYAEIIALAKDTAHGGSGEDAIGQLDFDISEAGNITTQTYIRLDGAGLITAFKNIQMSTGSQEIRFEDAIANASVATPSAGEITLFNDLTTGDLSVKKSSGATVNLETVGGGGSQTPWVSNIDADNFILQDAQAIEFRNANQSSLSTSTPYIHFDDPNMIFNVPTGDGMNFNIEGSSKFSITNTSLFALTLLNMSDNNISLDSGGNAQISHSSSGQNIVLEINNISQALEFQTTNGAGSIHWPISGFGHAISASTTQLKLDLGAATDNINFIWAGDTADQMIFTRNHIDFRSDATPFFIESIYNPTTPIDDTAFALYQHNFKNDIGTIEPWAEILMTATDVTNGSEDADIELRVIRGGTLETMLIIDANLNEIQFPSGADLDLQAGNIDNFTQLNADSGAKGTVTGSRGGNAALASVISILETYGMLNDSST